MKHPDVTSEKPVDDSETLWKLIWDPENIRNGKIVPESLRKPDFEPGESDTGNRNGVSVKRASMCVVEDFQAIAQAQHAKVPSKRLKPYLTDISVVAVRSVRSVRSVRAPGGEFVFDVVAAPRKNDPAHALVISKESTGLNPRERRLLFVALCYNTRAVELKLKT